MDWTEALEIVVGRTGHDRYRELTADDHPDRDAWRRRLIALAGGPEPTAEYPPLLRQAANLAGAVVRVVAAAARGEPVRVHPAVYDERRIACRTCEHNGERPEGVRCTKCGCGGLKLELASEQCADDPPRWGRFTGPAAPP